MTRRFISQGSAFEARIGYSRAVADGPHVWVAGTTGFDYATMAIVDDVAGQCLLQQGGWEVLDIDLGAAAPWRRRIARLPADGNVHEAPRRPFAAHELAQKPRAGRDVDRHVER